MATLVRVIESWNKRVNLAVLLALATALALLALLTTGGGGEQGDTPPLNFRGVTYDTGTR